MASAGPSARPAATAASMPSRTSAGNARIAVTPAAVQCLRQLLESEVGQAHRHGMLASESGGKAHVLVSEAQREGGRLVLAQKELVGQPVEDPLTPERPLAHREVVLMSAKPTTRPKASPAAATEIGEYCWRFAAHSSRRSEGSSP